MTNRLPALFLGHGTPMNAIGRNAYTEIWAGLGREVGKPRAILCISAHWYTRGTAVTAMERPKTIHDFGAFPQALFDVSYPAPGDPQLARRVQELLAPVPVALDDSWGLDHGAWGVLVHVYPQADVPIVQLSLDGTQPAEWHYEMGRRLARLRDEGVLIVGTGNTVHNLRLYRRGQVVEPLDWAVRFEARMKAWMEAGDAAGFLHYESLGRDALMAVPTPEHLLPLFYVLGTRAADEPLSFPVEGFDGGSVSMMSVRVG